MYTWLRRGYLREKQSLQIMAENNAIRTYNVKVRLDKMQQNSRCRLCGNRDGTINHKISECSELAQTEYKTRHDWVGKVINWELCKKFKFDITNKWYMHNPESVLGNGTHKVFRDFKIQTDHLISTRRRDLIRINEKERTCWIVEFAVPANHWLKWNKCVKRDKYLNLAREL